MVYCSHCGGFRPSIIDPDKGYICCAACGKLIDIEIYFDEPNYVTDNSSLSSSSGNSEQSQELHYDSDEEESCLTEVDRNTLDCNTSISHAQLDQSHSFDIDQELLDESVVDTRLCLEIPGLIADFMDDSTSSMHIHYENSAAVVSGGKHMSLSGDNWLSFGKDGDLTPVSKLSTNDKVRENSEDSDRWVCWVESSSSGLVLSESTLDSLIRTIGLKIYSADEL